MGRNSRIGFNLMSVIQRFLTEEQNAIGMVVRGYEDLFLKFGNWNLRQWLEFSSRLS